MYNVKLKSDGKPKAQEVEPIKKLKDIEKVKQYLLGKKSKRNYMLFVVGINIGLRAGDLLSLKIGDVVDAAGKFKESIVIVEEKTEKIREFNLNNSAKEATKLYLDSLNIYNFNDYLFRSRKGNGALTVRAAHKLIKSTMKELNIKGNYGTHTLRKTFGYHVYQNNVRDNPLILETLQKIFNHSTQSVTLKYIGITKEVITNVYLNLNL